MAPSRQCKQYSPANLENDEQTVGGGTLGVYKGEIHYLTVHCAVDLTVN